VRHFDHLPDAERERLFHRLPAPFDAGSAPGVLAVALGATLYVPGDRPDLAAVVRRCAARGVASMVICLEDSIADAVVPRAEAQTIAALADLAGSPDRPLLFVRVREAEQMARIVAGLGGDVAVLSGFVLPKFTATSGRRWLGLLRELAADAAGRGGRLLAMPVVESPEVIHRESRIGALTGLAELLDAERDLVLAVRTGATDLSGAYGLRRTRDLTVYDVRVVADVLADVVNVLGRADGSGFVITGPVWEYFAGTERLFRTRLRATPFEEHDATSLRQLLVDGALDGLLREVSLDQANGFTGKTVIHPSHVAAVHALSVVPHEEFADATDVLGGETEAQDVDRSGGGVLRSAYRNKMNEIGPHRAWAQRVLGRAAVFGVACEQVSFVDLLAADARAATDARATAAAR
jgi:citrate lyase beta subunit